MSEFRERLLYHPAHDWARIQGEEATFGITWYGQDALGEVVFFDPPEPGGQVITGQPYAEVESVKAVSEVIAPMSGQITAVNSELLDDPSAINRDPYGDGWLVRVRLSDPRQTETLLSVAAYRALLEDGNS